MPLDADGRAIFTPPASGLYTLQATATDVDGYSRSVTQLLRVRDPADTTAPVASLDVALTGRRLVAATDDPRPRGRQQPRKLAAGDRHAGTAADSAGWTLVAQGTQPSTACWPRCRPSRFQRGFYRLRLLAQDMAGRRAETGTTLEIAAAPEADALPAQRQRFPVDAGRT